MDLIDKLAELAARIERQKDRVATEEATKTAFILPFLQSLGYDVFNPNEVIPEFTADHGVKKGEKVDYAICLDDKITMLMECKSLGATLNAKYAGQLFRYFSVTDARFGILTDGARYLFFSDLEHPNKMDERPFFELNLLELNEFRVEELKQFAKTSFNLDAILSTASNLKYRRAIRSELAAEFESPSEEFVRFLTARVYPGRLTQAVKEEFSELVAGACKEFLRSKVNERIQSAFEPEVASIPAADAATLGGSASDSGIVTTEDEWAGYRIIQAIAAQITDPDLITLRDAKSYCAILFADNNRRPICRFYFGNKRRSVVIFEENDQIKIDIEKLSDLYKYSGHLTKVIGRYLA